ncbi:MAG: hypothetical protein ACRDSK_20335 [Actinophytocola sp.]|uniref:hypothetical protein n=1 Tax=Actinophytocola sp. TaxID=1872138 RepID=UPI003D6B427F
MSRKATFVAIGAALIAVLAEVVRNTVAGAAAVSSSIVIILVLLALLLVLTQLEALRASVDRLSQKAGFPSSTFQRSTRSRSATC